MLVSAPPEIGVFKKMFSLLVLLALFALFEAGREHCSGLIDLDTSIKNNTVNYWGYYESKASLQKLLSVL